ncbi:MAG: sulfur oxidation c-type cytochrome SoxA [Panacagrimonas sp.]
MNWKTGLRAFLVLAAASTGPSFAQDDANIFAQYREMFGDDNPAELAEIQGEELWKTARGPSKATLEKCDLGLGAGKVAGAYAALPRYFKDADRVQDLEARLAWCMVKLQGMKQEEVVAKPYSDQGQPATDMEALSAWIAGQSRGVPIAVPQKHPKEKLSYEIGEKLFNYRAGPYDFSCATCHSQSSKRIRLQTLPNLLEPKSAKAAFSTWPGYRISQGALRTIEWRMTDCARQQRLPQLVFTSDAAISLITYMGVQAKGEPMAAPGLKR